MAKNKKQDRSRQKAAAAERSQNQPEKGTADERERAGSPADMPRKGKKPSFGHN